MELFSSKANFSSANRWIEAVQPSLVHDVCFTHHDATTVREYGRVPGPAQLVEENQESFWTTARTFGLIDEALVQSVFSCRHAIPRWDLKTSVPIPELLWALSASSEGRELCARALPRLNSLEAWAFARNEVTRDVPLYGLLVPSACQRLSPNFAHTLTRCRQLNALELFWNIRCCPPGFEKLQIISPQQQQLIKLSLLSLNVWGVPGLTDRPRERFEMIGHRLKQTNYDVVALQEMWDARTAAIIGKSCYEHIVTSPDYPGLRGRGGLAILSRLPIVSHAWHAFKNYAGLECTVTKGVLLARLLHASGRSIVIVNTHLVSPPERGSNLLLSSAGTRQIRMLQLEELAQFVKNHTAPDDHVFVMGDLNAPERSVEQTRALELLGADLYRNRLPVPFDGSPQSNYQLGYTYDPRTNRNAGSIPPARLDYVFYRGPVTPEQIATEATIFGAEEHWKLSDHYGVSIRVTFPIPPKMNHETLG